MVCDTEVEHSLRVFENRSQIIVLQSALFVANKEGRGWGACGASDVGETCIRVHDGFVGESQRKETAWKS